VACLALDPSGIIREANHAAAELLRTSESALVGQPLFRFVASQQQVLLRDHFRTLTARCERQATDLSLRVPGSVHPIVVQIVSRMASTDVPEVVSVLVDITERRRAEMVLDFLDNAGQALSTVATTAAIVQQIPELAVPLLGDLCVVEFRDVANVIHHAAAHTDPRAAGVLRELGSAFFDLPGIAAKAANVLSGHGPQLLEQIEPSER
jgi:PAS domain S-box-containing protein